MNEYEIFLGSSIMPPISYDRCAVGNFIRKVNDAFRLQQIDMYLDLFLCEVENPSFTPGVLQKKQQEYDSVIACNTHLFLNLYHSRAGTFTLHELDVAMGVLPPEDILVMFRRTEAPEDSVQQLQQRLEADGLSYTTYDHVDAVKIALIRWLQAKEPALPIAVEDGTVRIGTVTVLRKGIADRDFRNAQ